ncbi:hypothetical protein [Modestobacter sp. Leaf380]|uniref:hypothetical protein n=1 Tax=Modestobacter sp. Leaf380 TaxID=1736356 RepID=UPI0007018A5F|nr:hypothetical protein [Modestobacter sp. Leaf380]KQS65833.1 hypothetical protein ASG41_14775 [Modestobacter sp. Leaf380]
MTTPREPVVPRTTRPRWPLVGAAVLLLVALGTAVLLARPVVGADIGGGLALLCTALLTVVLGVALAVRSTAVVPRRVASGALAVSGVAGTVAGTVAAFVAVDGSAQRIAVIGAAAVATSLAALLAR